MPDDEKIYDEGKRIDLWVSKRFKEVEERIEKIKEDISYLKNSRSTTSDHNLLVKKLRELEQKIEALEEGKDLHEAYTRLSEQISELKEVLREFLRIMCIDEPVGYLQDDLKDLFNKLSGEKEGNKDADRNSKCERKTTTLSSDSKPEEPMVNKMQDDEKRIHYFNDPCIGCNGNCNICSHYETIVKPYLKELIEEFLKSWDRFEKMFDKFDDVWHIENKVYKFIDEEKKKWEEQ